MLTKDETQRNCDQEVFRHVKHQELVYVLYMNMYWIYKTVKMIERGPSVCAVKKKVNHVRVIVNEDSLKPRHLASYT